MTLNSGILDEADALLIERVKQTRILYNTNSADFRLSHKKEQAWEILAANLGLSPQTARRRWTCLRDRYSRGLRHMRAKNSRKEDYCRGEFFRQMDFLRPFVRKRQSRSSNSWKINDLNGNGKNGKLQPDEAESYDESTDQYESKLDGTGAEDEFNLVTCELDPLESYEEYAAEQNITTETSTVPGSQQKFTKNEVMPIMLSPMTSSSNMVNSTNLQHQEQQHQMKVDSKSLETLPQQQETEDDFFCKSVAMYLRKLSRRHKIKAKVEMFQILEKYIEIEESTFSPLDQHRRDVQKH